MLNKVILVGSVKKTPEHAKTDKGINVLKIKVETKHKENTEWHNVNVYDKLALENKELKENDFVVITGRMSTRNYEAKDGTKRYFTNILCESISKINTNTKEDIKDVVDDEFDYDQIPF